MIHGSIRNAAKSIKFRSFHCAKIINTKNVVLAKSMVNFGPTDQPMSSRQSSSLTTAEPFLSQNSNPNEKLVRSLARLAETNCDDSAERAQNLILQSTSPVTSTALDDFCESIKHARIDHRSASDVLISLLKHGILPTNNDTVERMLKIVCPQSRRTDAPDLVDKNRQLLATVSELFNSRTVIISWTLMRFIIRWTSMMPAPMTRFENLYHFLHQLWQKNTHNSKHVPVADPLLWTDIVTFHKKVDTKKIVVAKKRFRVKPAIPELDAALILRENDWRKLRKAIGIFNKKWGETDQSNRLIGHFSRLMAIRGKHVTVHSMREMSGLENTDPEVILCGLCHGFFETKNYVEVLRQFNKMTVGESHPVYIRASKYHIAAMAEIGEIDKAIAVYTKMANKSGRALELALFHIIKSIVARGRVDRKSTWYCTEKPYSIEEGAALIRQLLKISHDFPASFYLNKLFVSMNHINIAYQDLQRWAVTLIELILVGRQDRTIQPILDSSATKQIVQWGFMKSPKTPWTSLDILKNAREKGAILTQSFVVNAYSAMITLFYIETPENFRKRIKEQMDPDMTLDKFIVTVRSEFQQRLGYSGFEMV